MTAKSPDDKWQAGDAYEAFMGRWSRQIAKRFVRWLACGAGRTWLDVGCGTGALTSAICELAEPSRVVACDPAEPLVRHAKSKLTDPRVSMLVAGFGDLPVNPGGFDHLVSGLVLNFLPDVPRAVREMKDRARPGGVVAAYVWDYAEGMQFLRFFWDEAVALDEKARELDEGARFPMCRHEKLEAIFSDAGLGDVRSEAIDIPTKFADFSDYWQPFLGGTGPAPSYVASLDKDQRTKLRERLERRLAQHPRGIIELYARAWAVRGTAP
jgi:ubiquinone/menaquinone biosynthesis C-methylase UbiE